MKLLRLTLFCLTLSNYVFAQSDTVYLNAAFQTIKEKEEAAYYRFYSSPEFGRCKVEDYYLSGKLHSTFNINTKDSTYEGFFTSYYENGQKEATGNYISGVKTGIWKVRFKDTNAIWVAEEYFPERKDTTEILKSYYKNGQLKRIQYLGKNLDGGTCYNEDGSVKKYTSFVVMPKPDYIWQQFVKKEIKYPRKSAHEGMHGRVNVQFMVAKDVSIRKVIALNDSESDLAKEAVRVVSLFPDWKPGVLDDEVVDMYFTLPITYRLE